MIVRIDIDCDNISELYQHLGVLRKQIKKETKRLNLDPLEDEFSHESEDHLKDNNCYGVHQVIIEEN